ncbi:unnamed protein product [Lactuca virosa]|uniref:Uncharacterized protein n=1 Tax=Lactuca virosa TaxID=75947 RepID=A0AAU9PMK8_9ASTR|nr:unnamed protein product [Lactuca virosa]
MFYHRQSLFSRSTTPVSVEDPPYSPPPRLLHLRPPLATFFVSNHRRPSAVTTYGQIDSFPHHLCCFICSQIDASFAAFIDTRYVTLSLSLDLKVCPSRQALCKSNGVSLKSGMLAV